MYVHKCTFFPPPPLPFFFRCDSRFYSFFPFYDLLHFALDSVFKTSLLLSIFFAFQSSVLRCSFLLSRKQSCQRKERKKENHGSKRRGKRKKSGR